MLFTNHYAGNTVCAPSRCALMKGYHMGHAGVRGNRQAMPSGKAKELLYEMEASRIESDIFRLGRQ